MVNRRALISNWSSVGGRPEFQPSIAIQNVLALQDLNPQDLILEDDYLTAVVVDQVGDDIRPSRIQVLALRRHEDRPAQYAPGQHLTPISLPKGYYTADVTYVVIWPDGFAAQDFHGVAPRLSRLAYYLYKKLDHHVAFESLYDPNIAEQLQDIAGQIRSVDIALTGPGRAAQIDNGLFGTLLPAVFGEQAPSVSIKVGMGRYGPRDRYLDEQVQESALRIAENASELVDRLVISGQSRSLNKAVELNLLNERLGEVVQLRPSEANSSFPEAGHAYDELERVCTSFRASGAIDDAVRAQLMRGS